jgi:hypothetical protein
LAFRLLPGPWARGGALREQGARGVRSGNRVKRRAIVGQGNLRKEGVTLSVVEAVDGLRVAVRARVTTRLAISCWRAMEGIRLVTVGMWRNAICHTQTEARMGTNSKE